MTTTTQITDTDVLLTAVRAATFAPSVHNSQPWRFEVDGDTLEVFADTGRWLKAIDPSGRELFISCGAAVYLARLALRGLAREITTALLPDPARPQLLARITMTGRQAPTEAERMLIRAIPLRYTDRGVYNSRQIPAHLIEEFRRGVASEDAWLRPVDDSADVAELATLLARADDVQEADPHYRHELAQWNRQDPRALDGIPHAAIPDVSVADRRSPYRLRDFDVDGTTADSPSDDAAPVERPFVCLIGTADDDKRAWLAAGQALGWLLLHAAAAGISASPMTQVLEVPSTRAELRQRLRLVSHPQMLLRMGYGTGQPTTHRRPLSEVVGR